MKYITLVLMSISLFVLAFYSSGNSEPTKKEVASKQRSKSQKVMPAVENSIITHGYVGISYLRQELIDDPKASVSIRLTQKSGRADIGKSTLKSIQEVIGDGISKGRISIRAQECIVHEWPDVLFQYDGHIGPSNIIFPSSQSKPQPRTLTLYFDDTGILIAVSKAYLTVDEIESANKHELEMQSKIEESKTPRGRAKSSFKYDGLEIVPRSTIDGQDFVIVGNLGNGLVIATKSGVTSDMPLTLEADARNKADTLEIGHWITFASKDFVSGSDIGEYYKAINIAKDNAINYLTDLEEKNTQSTQSSSQPKRTKGRLK